MIVVAELDKFLLTKEPYWDKLDSYLEPISYVFQRRKVKKTDLSMLLFIFHDFYSSLQNLPT